METSGTRRRINEEPGAAGRVLVDSLVRTNQLLNHEVQEEEYRADDVGDVAANPASSASSSS